jgi:hypothetical protein
MHTRVAAGLITGSLLLGGGVGAVLFGPTSAVAQSSSSSSQSQSDTPPANRPDHPRRGPHVRPNLGVAASALGISESDLRAALQSGKSLADVATANNVDPQKVIDALVADAQTKLAERVANGDITQAQADQISADLAQRITDQVNHAGGPGGPGCPGMDGATPPTPPAAPSNSNA